MFRFRRPHLLLLLGLSAPLCFATSHYCIASDGGFGHGGTTYIGIGFTVPGEGACAPWAGFTKTATTVVLMTNGVGCLSSDGKQLSVSLTSADPSYFGPGHTESDYIQFNRPASNDKFTTGQDSGAFSGSAEPATCTSSLLHLPSVHD